MNVEYHFMILCTKKIAILNEIDTRKYFLGCSKVHVRIISIGHFGSFDNFKKLDHTFEIDSFLPMGIVLS